MAGDDYEIVSHKEIIDLKKQIDNLKSTKKGDVSNKSLKLSIDTLNKNLELMIDLFREANKMMRADEKEALLVTDSMSPLMGKIDTLLEQNQTVAKGILTVADLVKGDEPDKGAQKSVAPMAGPMPRPAPQPMPQAAPQPMPQPMPPGPSLPPSGPRPLPPSMPSGPQPSSHPPSFPDPNMASNIPPLPKGQPESLGPKIQPPPGKKPLFK